MASGRMAGGDGMLFGFMAPFFKCMVGACQRETSCLGALAPNFREPPRARETAAAARHQADAFAQADPGEAEAEAETEQDPSVVGSSAAAAKEREDIAVEENLDNDAEEEDRQAEEHIEEDEAEEEAEEAPLPQDIEDVDVVLAEASAASTPQYATPALEPGWTADFSALAPLEPARACVHPASPDAPEYLSAQVYLGPRAPMGQLHPAAAKEEFRQDAGSPGLNLESLRLPSSLAATPQRIHAEIEPSAAAAEDAAAEEEGFKDESEVPADEEAAPALFPATACTETEPACESGPAHRARRSGRVQKENEEGRNDNKKEKKEKTGKKEKKEKKKDKTPKQQNVVAIGVVQKGPADAWIDDASYSTNNSWFMCCTGQADGRQQHKIPPKKK